MMNKIFFLFFIAAGFSQSLFSQELIVTDETNTILRSSNKNHPASSTKSTATVSLGLPFFDDFSRDEFMPDTTKWVWADSGKYLPFISVKKGLKPPSKGVASFDGATFYGKKHWPVLANGEADYLKSQNINLSPFQLGDSVYLSFFLEPAGLNDNPEHSDSFFVFFSTDTFGNYKKVIAIPGDSFPTTRFTQVMVKLDTSGYFFDGFHFILSSFGSLNGELDTWHLDYVTLGSGRNINDTLYIDHSVVQTKVRPVMGKYSALPWFMTPAWTAWDGIFIESTQLGGGSHSASILVELRNPEPLNGQWLSGTTAQTFTTTFSGQQFNEDSVPALSPQSFSSPAILQLNIKSNYSGSQSFLLNDVMQVEFSCDSVMGYDDGEADVAYGLNSNKGFGQRFILPDTLHDTISGVMLNFVPSMNYNSTSGVSTTTEGKPFILGIWNDAGGQPDTLITVVLAGMNIDYGTALNQYVRYAFSTMVKVPSIFYMGIIQNDAIPVAIGLDLNTDHRTDMYYQNSSLDWVNSSFKGTLMIRPEFWTATQPVISRERDIKFGEDNLKLWPNPVAGNNFFVEISGNETELTDMKLRDISGRELRMDYEKTNSNFFSIHFSETTAAGIYFVEINTETNGNQKRWTRKIIIQP